MNQRQQVHRESMDLLHLEVNTLRCHQPQECGHYERGDFHSQVNRRTRWRTSRVMV